VIPIDCGQLAPVDGFMGSLGGNPNDQARGRNDAIVSPEHRSSQPPDPVDEVTLRMQAKTAHPTSPPVRSEPPKQHKNHNDDQDGSEDTDAAVPITVTVAAKAATEATEQENDEDDDEDGSERHDACSLCRTGLYLNCPG